MNQCCFKQVVHDEMAPVCELGGKFVITSPINQPCTFINQKKKIDFPFLNTANDYLTRSYNQEAYIACQNIVPKH